MSTNDDEIDESGAGVGAGYAAFQLSRALDTQRTHADPDVRARAAQRIARWQAVLAHALDQTADFGSRTPLAGIPAWVTLDVATGGFATGGLRAGGELADHERDMALALPGLREGHERLDLNVHHLSAAGLQALQSRLEDGNYAVDVPEEGALLIVAWLLRHGHDREAQAVIGTIAPFFERLRFFPRAGTASAASGEVCVASAGSVQRQLESLEPQRQIEMQRRAIDVWLPLYDTAVALFLETYEDGWPCQRFASAWPGAARTAVAAFAAAQRQAAEAKQVDKHRVAELYALLERCLQGPETLDGRAVGRVRRIVDDFVRKHGRPASIDHQLRRARQRADVSGPPHARIGETVADRLRRQVAADDGIDDLESLLQPVTADESERFALPVGTAIPAGIRHRLRRCRRAPIEQLVEEGVITSAEVIAQLLPQLAGQIHGAAFADPALRGLFAAIYRAFRRRRSLLLLNLERQVAFDELPWIAALKSLRRTGGEAAASARATLVQTAALTVRAFPQTIVPNKLLREFGALARTADTPCTFTEELAADIFMGRFSPTFVRAAELAIRSLPGDSLYANYYAIDAATASRVFDLARQSSAGKSSATDGLAELCAERAGVSPGTWRPAINGTIIEQQQILTTHNLAPMFGELGLAPLLQAELPPLALRTFDWICRRLERLPPGGHARLIAVKKCAYAWRQMMFYLSHAGSQPRTDTIAEIVATFESRKPSFAHRLGPALRGLQRAAAGAVLPQRQADVDGSRVFLGWTSGRHWLLAD
ncbi:MAG: hypothetical protein BGP24_14150 [Lysobacterales bacterium 69-70]|nr:hypothetical protein [Xanthomonadaceae bacterium]ODU35234.1 MAG: hypothetical protein ABS97_04985 [Xanthomonadaceae bacterium SCN 69-320]ODV15763.1 MAG: hypothetical protein ABT27_21820 [Xanthomonadaceae bacterium SCN 69-25]OJY94134.1 MAG: hypothetical protein BGP24_14150 [Xanthomonadales bacterium 69-70]